MADPTTCCYLKLATALSVLNAPVPARDDLDPCTEPAAFSTAVVLQSDGLDIEVYARTCEAHDQLSWTIPGYERSTRLRAPKPAPS